VRVALFLGGGSYGGDGYFSIGAGVGYFVLPGLQIGAEGKQWIGLDPTVTQVSPYVTYTIYQLPPIHPYVGFFYRHWFVWDAEDEDTLGGRAGLQYIVQQRVALSGGVAYERTISDCIANCDNVYPEFGVTFTF
jgi:hypothetical protein